MTERIIAVFYTCFIAVIKGAAKGRFMHIQLLIEIFDTSGIHSLSVNFQSHI